MKDHAFSGRDVEDALRAAAEGLGLPASSIKYVVLEPGSPGGLGVKPSPARIAVLLDASAPKARAAPAAPSGTSAPVDPKADVRGVMRALTEGAGLEIGVDLEDRDGTLEVRLTGRDTVFFLGADGQGEVHRALEHLLQRVYATAGGERPLRVECEGLRERREQLLVETALSLAAAVREDGVARTTGPLNSYERRVIHVALSEAAGVVTYSVGEGGDRRVTVALGPPAGSPDAD